MVFAGAAEDARRRDFTVNAMFYDPAADQLHDFVSGRSDLAARVIRAVGDPAARFAEDHLRLLRAVRFAATLILRWRADTARAIANHAGSIERISAERIQIEITRTLLESPRAGDAIRQLEELGLLRHIIPEASAMCGQAQPPQFHPEGDVFTHTVLMLNAMPPQPPLRLAWRRCCMTSASPPPAARPKSACVLTGTRRWAPKWRAAIMQRLRMPRDDIKAVTFCIANHMRYGSAAHEASPLGRCCG